jgi:ketol-acid reductoisomerase
MFRAQYEVLRANGHSPSEAFNETVEEATQSLFPLIGQHGFVDIYSCLYSVLCGTDVTAISGDCII